MRFNILDSENENSRGDDLSSEVNHSTNDSQIINETSQSVNNRHPSSFLSILETSQNGSSSQRNTVDGMQTFDDHFIQVFNNYSNQFDPNYARSFINSHYLNQNSSSELNPDGGGADSDTKMNNQQHHHHQFEKNVRSFQHPTSRLQEQVRNSSSPSRKRTQNQSNSTNSGHNGLMDYVHYYDVYSPSNGTSVPSSPFSKRNRGYLHNVVITHHVCDLAPEILSYILQYLNTYDLLTCARPVCTKFQQLVDQDGELCACGFEIPTHLLINLKEECFIRDIFSKRLPQTWKKVVFTKQHYLPLLLFEKIFTECNSLEQVVIRDCHQFQESSIPLLLNMAPGLKKLEIHSSSGLMSLTRRSHNFHNHHGANNDEKEGWRVITSTPLALTCLRLTNFKSTSSVVRMISENLLPHLKELKISRPPVNSINMSHMDAMTNKLSDLEHFELALPLYATDFNHNSSLVVVDSLVQALLIKNVPLVFLSLEGVSCSIKTFVNLFSHGLTLEHLAIDLHTNTFNTDKSSSLVDNEEFFKPLDRLRSVKIRLDDKHRTHDFNNSLIVKYCLPSIHLTSIELSKIVLTDYSQIINAFSHCKTQLKILKLVGTFLPSSVLLSILANCPNLEHLVVSNRSNEFLFNKVIEEESEGEEDCTSTGSESTGTSTSDGSLSPPSSIGSFGSSSSSSNSSPERIIRSGTDVNDEELCRILFYCPKLQYLSIKSDNITGTFLSRVQASLSLYHLTLSSNKLRFSELSSANIKCPLIRSLVVQSRSIRDDDIQHICLIFNSLNALTLDSMQLTSDIFYHISNFGPSIVTLNIFSNILFEPPKTLVRNSNSFLRNIYFYSWKEIPLRMYNMLQIAFPRYQYRQNNFFSHNESLSMIERSLILKYIQNLILETFAKEKSELILSDHTLLEKLYQISLKVLSLQIISEHCIVFENQMARDGMIDELKIPFQFLLSLFENLIYSGGSYNDNLQHFLNRLLELPFKELEDRSKYTFNTISHELA